MRSNVWEALATGSLALAVGSVLMLFPIKGTYWPFVGTFITGATAYFLYDEFLEPRLKAAEYIEGFGDVRTGGTKDFNQLYVHGNLPEEVLKPARGLGLDFSDQ
jgi:hypothetical protein